MAKKPVPAKRGHGQTQVEPKLRMATRAYEGPIPPPDQLAAFSQIIPDGANRIMLMAEKSLDLQVSRQEKILHTRAKAMTHEHIEVVLGQIFSFILCLCVLGGGIALIWHGSPVPGTILSGASLTSVVATLVKRGKNRK